MTIRPYIHPFPARMAPEIALAALRGTAPDGLVLDPMAGSGTVLRAASDLGLSAVGFDADPLAVLMAGVWTTPIDCARLHAAADETIARAAAPDAPSTVDWIDGDIDTRTYVDYWFAHRQQLGLSRLVNAIALSDPSFVPALKLALSRTIVTKDRGASLARDVSHSRPHRVKVTNDFDVFAGFRQAVARIGGRLAAAPPPGGVSVLLGDARALSVIGNSTVSQVVTSPPYLNAIDYMRGHRLSLVWLGYTVGELARIRSESIGSERAPDARAGHEWLGTVKRHLPGMSALERRFQNIFDRYLLDLGAVMDETARVLKRSGSAVFVVGNSTIRGVFLDNSAAVAAIAANRGLHLVDRYERELPPNRRYLPPPGGTAVSSLQGRMRTEVVLTFGKR